MLRHFKMELKRQQERENERQLGGGGGGGTNLLLVAQQQENTSSAAVRPLASADTQAVNLKRKREDDMDARQVSQAGGKHATNQQVKRVRGRRSSKPAMEKRRRARINECLDILKSYVLNDTGNLSRLGIDLSARENYSLDEDSIARQILKSSGLIHRHRGRKNPNKLEKADILELTVDYVRRLHEQRDELLVTAILAPQEPKRRHIATADGGRPVPLVVQQQQQQQAMAYGDQLVTVPAHLSEPLTLDLSPQSRLASSSVMQETRCQGATTPPILQAAYCPPPNTPLTPPSSSSCAAQSDGSHDLTTRSAATAAAYQNQVSQMQLLSQALDGRYKLYDYASFHSTQQQ